jgi:hypothetical protein
MKKHVISTQRSYSKLWQVILYYKREVWQIHNKKYFSNPMLTASSRALKNHYPNQNNSSIYTQLQIGVALLKTDSPHPKISLSFRLVRVLTVNCQLLINWEIKWNTFLRLLYWLEFFRSFSRNLILSKADLQGTFKIIVKVK